MWNLKITLPAVILAGGTLLCSTATYGKAEYTKKEKKACTFCHTAANSKELNDAGKYYQEHKSLDGYKK
jgi:hypothetical protein